MRLRPYRAVALAISRKGNNLDRTAHSRHHRALCTLGPTKRRVRRVIANCHIGRGRRQPTAQVVIRHNARLPQLAIVIVANAIATASINRPHRR